MPKPKESAKKVKNKIVKVSDKEYRLPCSACRKTAVVFKIGRFIGEKDPVLVYQGITKEKSLGNEHTKKIFDWLEKGEISKIHSYLGKRREEKGIGYFIMEDGMDAYCPKCDKIYCKKHYSVVEIWDEDFYDYSEGTCPKGHKRIVDD